MAGSLDIKQRRGVVWALEDVRSGLVDRCGAGASGRVGPLPSVQGQGVKTERFRLAHGVLRKWASDKARRIARILARIERCSITRAFQNGIVVY